MLRVYLYYLHVERGHHCYVTVSNEVCLRNISINVNE